MTSEETYRIKGDEIYESEANVIKTIKREYYYFLEVVRSGNYEGAQDTPQDELDAWYRDSKRDFKFYLYPKDGHIIELGFDMFPITIPDSISDLKHLKSLSLISCGIKKFPSSFSNLDSLRKINLSSNDLEVLPKEILALKNLEYLTINDNQFTDLNPIINAYDRLKRLGANYNLIQIIPKSIGRLNNLLSLNLNHNKISKIPEELFNLQNLQFLRLSDNRLEEVSGSLGKLKNLDILSLNRNYIKKLPDSIGNLNKLSTIEIIHNKLNRLPDSFWGLTKLNEVYLSHNNIEILPDSIRNLVNLAMLHLNHNKLKKIPRSIGKLQNLRRFEIAGNRLISLPQSLSNISSLEFIIFNNNNIVEHPFFRHLNIIPALSMGYKDIKCLGRALISTNELNVVDLLKNLRGDPKKLILFYSDYFKYSDFDGKKIGMSRSVMKLIEEEKYMDLINFYQRSDPRNHTKNKFHRKTKGKLIKSTKRITKFQKNPQSIVKQKLQIFSQMENEMKKLRIEIGNLSLKDPKKHEKEKMLKSLTKQLDAMKKKFSFK